MLDFKKNQKKFMAIFSVGLMIAFALPSAVSNYSKNREVTIGYVGADKVTNKDIAQAKADWDALRMLNRTWPPDPQDPSGQMRVMPLTDRVFGVAKAREIQNNPELYFLLQREADRMGVTAPQDFVRETLANRVPSPGDTLSDAELAPLVENFAKVFAAARVAGLGIQASSPEVREDLSRLQPFSANLVEFKAQDYLSKVPPYTDAERQAKLDEQYKRFKDVLPTTRPTNPKTGQPQNDFAFGYKVPNQVQVQYIEVPRDAVVQLVKSKITEVDAIKYYMENKDKFPTTRPAEPVTFRASPPPPGVATVVASQPATQVAVPKIFTESYVPDPTKMPPPAQMTFKDYKEKVYEALTAERADQLSNDIVAEINSTLAADYAEFKKSAAGQQLTSASTTLPTTAPAVPNSSLGVPYTSYAYLQKLALHVQEKFELLPTVGFDVGLRTEEQLQASSPLAHASLTGAPRDAIRNAGQPSNMQQYLALMRMERVISFPSYATNFIEPLFNPAMQGTARALALRTLALFEPSSVLEGAQNMFVFRAIQAVPAHSAPQDEVKEQLLADARLRDAYDLARKDAERLAADAQKSRLSTAAAAAGKKVLATGMIDVHAPPDLGALSITDQDTRTVFVNAAYDLLKAGQKGADAQHPVGVIDLKPITTVFAGEVNEIKPSWSPNTLTAYERMMKVELDQSALASSHALWLDANDIVRRMQYRELNPTRKPTPAAPQEPQQPEQNPFVP